jgi:cytochrome P450
VDRPVCAAGGDLPRTSFVEAPGFNLLVVLANALQGLFRPRAAAVLPATMLDIDRWAVGLLDRVRRRHGPGPVWVPVATGRALLVLTRDDVRRVLEGSPCPFASDPDAKRRGMSHFQPDALTISRGDLWRNRRRFTEAVLDTSAPRHRLADRFATVARTETEAMLAASAGELRWDAWHGAFRRITRRVVLGDAARDDEQLADLLAALMEEANRLPSKRSDRFDPFMARLTGHVEAAEAGSLASLFAGAPSDAETDAVGQVPHWLFAMGDTLAANAFRALALLASHPYPRARAVDEVAANGELPYLVACLQEAMRLWPTTPLLSRVLVEDVDWSGVTVPAGTQVLISNTFNHRDSATHRDADRFNPDAWTRGGASGDWTFNHFSHGPQRCPGASLALLLGSQVLAAVLREREPVLLRPRLQPRRPLPHMVDAFRVRVGVPRRGHPRPDARASTTGVPSAG